MADIELTGDASSLNRALEQARVGFTRIEAATARIAKTTDQYNQQGLLTTKRIEAIDASSRKLATTFFKTADGLKTLTVGAAGLSTNILEVSNSVFLADRATQLLNAATQKQIILNDQLLGATGPTVARLTVLRQRNEELAASFRRAAAAGAALRSELGGRVGGFAGGRTTTPTELRNRLAALREAGAAELAQQKQTAADQTAILKKLEAQRLQIVKRVAAENRKVEQERLAAIEAEIVARKRVEAQRLREADLILAETKAEEAAKLRAAERELAGRKQVEAQRLREAALILAEVKAEEAAKLRATEKELAARKRIEAQRIKEADLILAEVKAEEAAKLRAAEKEFTARKRIEAQRLREAALIREEIVLEELKAKRIAQSLALSTRRPGVDLRTKGEGGIASKQQVQEFLKAERALQKLVATGKTGFAQVEAAIQKARAGTLQLAQATTQAQQAALRLVAAEKQVAAGAKEIAANAQQAKAAFGGLAASVVSLGRLLGISLLIGGAFRLVQALTDAAEAAGELTIKIAEIETITKNNNFATDQWAQGLRDLSNAFGIDTLKQAEGAYQVLSNQIRGANNETLQGADALKFLETANRLAVTGVTDTATATNLLTAALNSFRLPAEEAAVVSTKLFKAVELGRLRIADLSDIFGRVAVPARQLGISLDEVLGSISSLTIQGFKSEEAITGIRNVILKLIKPTEAGRKALDALGASSGQALIQARGFIPGLEAFIEEVGKTVEGFGEGFGRIRAIIGALGLIGKNADITADSIRGIRTASTEAFNEDLNRIIGSTGKQLELAGQQARNFFEKEIGQPALRAIAAYIKSSGGIVNVIKNAADAVVLFGKALIALTLIIKANSLALAANAANVTLVQGVYLAAAGAAAKARAAVFALSGALAATPIGALLTATAAIAGLSELAKRASIERLEDLGRENLAIFKLNEDRRRKIDDAQSASTRRFQDEFKKRIQVVAQFIATIRARQNEVAQTLADNAKKIAGQFTVIVQAFRQSVTKQASVATTAFKKFTKTAEKAAKLTQKILQQETTAQFGIDVDVAGIGKRIELIEAEILTSRDRIAKSTREGNLKTFEIERKRLNELVKLRITAELKFADEQSKLQRERAGAIAQRQSAQTRAERKIANDRLKSIDRQNKILKEGTSQQFKQEKELQKLRAEVTKTENAAQLKKALDSLNALKREQKRLNTLAEQERKIRDQTVEETIQQAEQLEKIRQINEKRAKDAQKEATRIRALQLSFNLLTKDAEGFNKKRVTEGETAEEINKAIAEQQKRFADLRELAGQLGGGAQTQEIFVQRELNLREQGQNKIDILEKEAAVARLEELREQGALRLKQASEISDLEKRNLQVLQNDVGRLENVLANREFATRRGPAQGELLRSGLGLPQADFRGGGAQNEKLVSQFLEIVKQGKILNSLISEQQKRFTTGRQIEINTLIDEISKSKILNPDIVALRGERLRNVADSENVVAARTINESTQRFLSSLKRVSDATSDFGIRQLEVSKLLRALPAEEARKESEKVIQQEVDNRSEHVKALEETIRITKEINAIRAGKKVLPGPTTVPGATPLRGGEGVSLFSDLQSNLERAIRGSQKVADDSAKRAGRFRANADAEQQAKNNPELEKQLDQLREDIRKKRLASAERAEIGATAKAIRPEAKKIDTTIKLGRGAPSIASQQARIQAALKEQAEARAKTLKAERGAKKKAAQDRKAAAVAAGEISSGTRGGALVARGRLRGPGLGNFNAQGQQVSRGAAKQLTIAEQQLNETKKTNSILSGEKPGEKPGEKRGSNIAAGGDRLTGLLGGLDLLNRGQTAAAEELKRAKDAQKIAPFDRVQGPQPIGQSQRTEFPEGFAPQLMPPRGVKIEPTQPFEQTVNNAVTIEINGLDKTPGELVIELIPPLKRAIRQGLLTDRKSK